MHFETSRWVDYARGLVDADLRTAMDQHLRDGCARCAAEARLFTRVAAATAADARFEPPEYARRAARAVFALHRPAEVQLSTNLPLRLVYDSFRDFAPAGIRAGQPFSRHVLYEAGPYAVDVRLELERGARKLLLTGQVANAQSSHGAEDVPVFLLDGQNVVVQSVCNARGEFQMEYEARPGLRLVVDVGTTEQIELPLSV